MCTEQLISNYISLIYQIIEEYFKTQDMANLIFNLQQILDALNSCL